MELPTASSAAQRASSTGLDRLGELRARLSSFASPFSQATRPLKVRFAEGSSLPAYLRPIWAREGIAFVLQPGAESTPERPQHALVLFDDVYALEAGASPTVRFHRADGTEQADAITQWHGRRTLQPGSVARLSRDHGTATVLQAKGANHVDQGPSGSLRRARAPAPAGQGRRCQVLSGNGQRPHLPGRHLVHPHPASHPRPGRSP